MQIVQLYILFLHCNNRTSMTIFTRINFHLVILLVKSFKYACVSLKINALRIIEMKKSFILVTKEMFF